jgi:hypothetical protein
MPLTRQFASNGIVSTYYKKIEKKMGEDDYLSEWAECPFLARQEVAHDRRHITPRPYWSNNNPNKGKPTRTSASD